MATTTVMVSDISRSSQKQQEAMTPMAGSVERVVSMTDQNMAVGGETNVTVTYLGEMVDRMQKSVAQYSI